MHLASISGGTDIMGCFVMGVPTLPVWSGEIQGAALGMAVDVWNDDARPVRLAMQPLFAVLDRALGGGWVTLVAQRRAGDA